MESIYSTVYSIVINQINANKGQMFFPLISALFIYILINNLVGMVPYSFAPTSHFILTFSISFTIVIGCPLGLLPLLVLIEFISYLSRNVSLGLRLAANILSGHMLLNILSGFTYNIMSSGILYFFLGLVPLLFIIAFSGLEIGIAFIQAQCSFSYSRIRCKMTTIRNRFNKSFRITFIKHSVTVTYSHHSLIQGNRSGALYGLVYTIILAVIFTAFQFIERYIFIMFLFWNRVPRFTCNNRYCFFSSRFMTSSCLPFNRKSSLRFRICNIILTFCRCSMIIFIYIGVLLRIIKISYYKSKDAINGSNIPKNKVEFDDGSE
ncbi:hypothetical protein IEQ34_024871 [Dendrobium chrysotoxum]|uniref:F-ATPase protein 6 n=1 Tax=Dendrobium chrysotoxum TaxID=161865 RepID=A0AAV7FQS9_DENCH|nr:hypothetical protein IEQ34_024871 [Dendrobium chrysotoxum]